MRKLSIIGASVLAAIFSTGVASAQSNLTGRVFTYDSSTTTNGSASFELDNNTLTSSGTVNNSVSNATTSGANFGVKTVINVLSYVWLSGNLAGVYSVRGFGTQTDSQQDNLVEVRTNRALTFTPSGFTKLKSGATDASAMGSITYQIGLYKDYSSTVAGLGTLVQQSTAQVDDAFVSPVSAAMTDLPTDGKLTLRVSRTLKLTQLAQGGQQYSATGTLGLSIN